MTKLLLAAAIATATLPALAADVGVSVGISQPGLYGRIDIGAVPPPQVIYQTPMIIQRAPSVVAAEPIYLRVPPGHERHWAKHCRKYGACGQPVYFVQESWYREVYVPHARPAAYVAPQPVYAAPRPVYVEPRPVYIEDRGHGHGHGRGRGRD